MHILAILLQGCCEVFEVSLGRMKLIRMKDF